MEATVLASSPFALVYVVNRPPLSRLTPPLSVPAQTLPSRAWYTEKTLF
jgi:hypothetical protein